MVSALLMLGLGFAAGYLQALYFHAPKDWAKLMEKVLQFQDWARKAQKQQGDVKKKTAHKIFSFSRKKRDKQSMERKVDQDGYIELEEKKE